LFVLIDSCHDGRFLRDFAYDNVANNRYLVFGRSESEACEIL
jgi:predicted DCC family thiol-disulfide oxidoreductase YuxK